MYDEVDADVYTSYVKPVIDSNERSEVKKLKKEIEQLKKEVEYLNRTLDETRKIQI